MYVGARLSLAMMMLRVRFSPGPPKFYGSEVAKIASGGNAYWAPERSCSADPPFLALTLK